MAASAGSAGGGTNWISRLNRVGQVDDIDGALTRLLFLPIAAFFIQAANAVEAISNVVIQPLGAFADGLGAIARSLLGDGVADIIEAGAVATATDVSLFGIGGFPVSLGIIAVSGFVLVTYLSQTESSNWLPFANFDLPIGTRESPEED